MTPVGVVYAVLGLWALVFVLALVSPLATGRIKRIVPGPPIARSENPSGFYGTLALSLLGLVIVLFIMRFMLHTSMPGPWAEAMLATGLARFGL